MITKLLILSNWYILMKKQSEGAIFYLNFKQSAANL